MRKPIFYFLALIFFLTCACNLPVRSLPGSLDLPKTPQAQQTPQNPQTLEKTTAVMITTPEKATLIPQAPSLQPAATATLPLEYDPATHTAYSVQSGDTLNAVAAHYGVSPFEIHSSEPIPPQGLLSNHQILVIPKLSEEVSFPRFLLPDSEIVNSACGRNFNIQEFVQAAQGQLSTYSQVVEGQTLSGAEVVQLVAESASVNPRFLLAFIEYRSGWVLSIPPEPNFTHPLGLNIPNNEGLYLELSIAANLLNIGYYGWREGTMTKLTFLDYGSARISPDLNAGSVALQYLFARMFRKPTWENELYGANGFQVVFEKMFGDPMACARSAEPIFPDGLQAPALELPFSAGEAWAMTGGLHSDWLTGTARGALDFAPITGEPPCAVSRAWVRASAAGIVTRAEVGIVKLALVDEAGKNTGWELLYMHIAKAERIAVGTRVATDDPLGHPSCEGGAASGTHVHIARMYRGEWIGAGDSIPLILSGWLAVPGEKPYQSTLVKGGQVVASDILGSGNSMIIR